MLLEWLSKSYEEHSIAWLLIASILGGLVSLSLKFLFDTYFNAIFEQRRERSRLVNHYNSPLLRTAISLERRVNNLIRSGKSSGYGEDDYYTISTLYLFAEHLAWIRILERKINFLQFNNSKKSKEFQRRLNGIFRALTSWGYFKKHETYSVEQIENSSIPRLILTAIGEAMIQEKDGECLPIEFTSFVDGYYHKPNDFRWFTYLGNFLNCFTDNSLIFGRLIILQAHLQFFISFLQKEKRFEISEKLRDNIKLLDDPKIGRGLLEYLKN